jgi:general L-amino acid transport system substrate-binding protein
MRKSTCLFLLLLCLAGGVLSAGAANAGSVLDKVKADGVLHCGSVERPGLASLGEDGAWQGLNVDICRAVASAVLGSPDHIAFQEYETPKQFDAIRNGDDELFFLTASEIHRAKLGGLVLPGPAVFLQTTAVMVPKAAKERHLKDLAGAKVCYLTPSNVENSVNAFFDHNHQAFQPMPFSEDGEMVDAYKVQFCHALAYERTTLATLMDDTGINNLKNRILPEPLAVFPVMAVTATKDAQWSAIVAWTVFSLISAERPETKWYHGGVKALPVDGAELGLDSGWQDRVIKAVGHYGEIFERHLGRKSPLKMERGLNANQVDGGLLLAPYLE